MVAIEFKNVDKWFTLPTHRIHTLKELAVNTLLRRYRVERRRHVVLRNFNMSIPTGTTLGIIGRNGVGKSTILKLIARVLRPNRGEIRVHGSVSGLLEVGAGFHPELTGRENIYLYGAILGLPRRWIDRQFASILEFADIGEHLDTPVKNYSSGMYMRLAFSVSVHVDPDILLIDEVLAVGDEAFQRKCLERIDLFRAAGKTILFVSHDLELVRHVAGRVLLVRSDGSVQEGNPDEMLQQYRDEVQKQTLCGSDTRIVNLSVAGLETPARPNTEGPRSLTLTVTVESRQPTTVGLALALKTPMGLLLNRSSSLDEGITYRIVPGQQNIRVRCHLPPLLAGDYDLEVDLLESGRDVMRGGGSVRARLVVPGERAAQVGVLPVQLTWQDE